MAQRHEIEAWVSPDMWDDPEAGRRAVDAIEESGSDDEEVWSAITRREDGVDLDSAARAHRDARRELDRATQDLRWQVTLALHEGMTESEVARQAGVSRTTVRSWVGK